jgi:organic radical activating enzyme
MSTLKVNEMFRSLQGEGLLAGSRATFLRLAGCNLHCRWCDTWFAWNFGDGREKRHGLPTVRHEDEVREREIPLVAADLLRLGADHVVLTGGEPFLQQGSVIELLRLLPDGACVEVETAGTIAPLGGLVRHVAYFNVSPKLASSGNPMRKRYRPNNLRSFVATGKAVFKFVVADPVTDIPEIEAIVAECGLTNVMLMPEGATRAQQLERMGMVWDLALSKGWDISPRLHILAHDDKRGV